MWQFWIDRGGTFTDVVARAARRRARDAASCCPRTRSATATPPSRASASCWAGARRAGAAERIDAVKMGTTVATNALLERKGDRTLLVITRGFGDALRIGYQDRPRHLRPPHHAARTAVRAGRSKSDERLRRRRRRCDVRSTSTRCAARAARGAWREGYRAVAIVFMHGYRYPAARGARRPRSGARRSASRRSRPATRSAR